MNRKLVLLMSLVIVLIAMLEVTFNVQSVEASGTIYIRADGSIEGTTYISTVDNVTYTFTDNIINQTIVVEKDNIVVDGAGYTVQGTGSVTGIDLSHRSNVTLENIEVTNFNHGIFLNFSSNNTITGNNASNNGQCGIALWGSSNNTLSGNKASNNGQCGIELLDSSNNTITGNNASNNAFGIVHDGSSNNTLSGNNFSNNNYGIVLDGSSNNNVLAGNNASNNSQYGIFLAGSSNNTLSDNNFSNNNYGMFLDGSSNNTLSGNKASNNGQCGIALWGSSNNTLSDNNASLNIYSGICLSYSSNNRFYHNYLINNTAQVHNGNSTNAWDDGAGKGNYWSDYQDKYPNAEKTDGIWDTPYVIDENNQDNYPIVPEFPSFLILTLLMIATFSTVVYVKKRETRINS